MTPAEAHELCRNAGIPDPAALTEARLADPLLSAHARQRVKREGAPDPGKPTRAPATPRPPGGPTRTGLAADPENGATGHAGMPAATTSVLRDPDAVAFLVPACPVPQPRARHGRTRTGNPVTYQAARDHPIHAFKAAVIQAAGRAMDGRPPLDGPLCLEVSFYLPRPARLDATAGRGDNKRPRFPTGPLPHDTRPDLDNLLKAVKDACNSILWRDDGQVCECYATKFYAAQGRPPRVVVRVARWGVQVEAP